MAELFGIKGHKFSPSKFIITVRQGSVKTETPDAMYFLKITFAGFVQMISEYPSEGYCLFEMSTSNKKV